MGHQSPHMPLLQSRPQFADSEFSARDLVLTILKVLGSDPDHTASIIVGLVALLDEVRRGKRRGEGSACQPRVAMLTPTASRIYHGLLCFSPLPLHPPQVLHLCLIRLTWSYTARRPASVPYTNNTPRWRLFVYVPETRSQD
ncbi:hypothetical protein D9756_010312 [Leucocoprinus leucothites]|uniref:Uncharacterized protein n=1 Tax=Leucocoprinus leucothites TaxID=201217 RepID=A0A8H5CVD8_9AGAR|nr:hypothetical protein D9756_010312 [Leucoagaricus leucothites]